MCITPKIFHNIYEEMLAAGQEISSHYSDLYVKKTPESETIINNSGWATIDTFINQIDGCVWYDIPFAYMPYWEAKEKTKAG